jgi:hypothetical protein
MPNSVVKLHIKENTIKGQASIPFIELENTLHKSIATEEIITTNSVYETYFTNHIRVISKNGQWKTHIDTMYICEDTDSFIGKYQEISVHFTLTPADKVDLRDFEFGYDAIIHQVITHKILVYIQEDWKNGISIESEAQPIGSIALDIPTGKIIPLHIQLSEGSIWKGFVGMLSFGMQHIREGLDHILFLLTLLVVAPLKVIVDKNKRTWSLFQGVSYTVQRFLKISLAFTLGHSLTLLLGTFNLLPIHSQYIEISIALTILLAAIHAIKPLFEQRETHIALAFGSIHGLAFSYSLANLELSLSSKIISMVGFNIGIEMMQIFIMLIYFPIILASTFHFYHKIRIFFSCLAILMALAWLLERITNQPNIITKFLEFLA